MNKLLELARAKLGSGYIWGAMGEQLTADKLQWFENTFGIQHYINSSFNATKWIGKQVFDCSGLVQWCLTQLGCMNQDKINAQMFYDICEPVAKPFLIPGDLVFIKPSGQEIDHIGIYAGNGQTIEAMGTAYGVVEGDVNRFNVFGRLKFNLEGTNMDWKAILEKVSANSTDWENAITVAVNAANADGNLGALEIFKFLPDIIVKIYKGGSQNV